MKKKEAKQPEILDIRRDNFSTNVRAYRIHRIAGCITIFIFSRVAFCLIVAIILCWGAPIRLHAFDKKQYARAIRFKTCINCDLYMANFSGVDLSYADFTGSNLILASFQKATLYKAIFKKANISGANFEGALWINGMICQPNSYGKCNFSAQK